MIEIRRTDNKKLLKTVNCHNEAKKFCDDYFRRIRSISNIKKFSLYWVRLDSPRNT